MGYGIGSLIDSSRQDSVWISDRSSWEMTESDSIRVSSKGNRVIDGLFVRWSQLPDTMYEAIYSANIPESAPSLPQLHDTVEVRIRPGARQQQIYAGEFSGFTVDWYSSRAMVKVSQNNRFTWISLREIESVNGMDGMSLSGAALEVLLSRGDVPIDQGMIMCVGGSDLLITVNEIDAIQVVKESRLRWTGLALGAVVDVGALIWMLTYDPPRGFLNVGIP